MHHLSGFQVAKRFHSFAACRNTMRQGFIIVICRCFLISHLRSFPTHSSTLSLFSGLFSVSSSLPHCTCSNRQQCPQLLLVSFSFLFSLFSFLCTLWTHRSELLSSSNRVRFVSSHARQRFKTVVVVADLRLSLSLCSPPSSFVSQRVLCCSSC